MADALAITLRESAAASAGGQSTPVDVGALRKMAQLKLEVTSVSGTTPKLIVTVETGPSSSGPWRSLTGWEATSVHAQERSFGETDRYVRLNWTIDGTAGPSFTFSVAGVAHVLYAAPSQVRLHCLPARTISEERIGDFLDSCLAATDEAAGYLNSSYVLPITAWDTDLTKQTSRLALYDFMNQRGWQPEGPDAIIIDAYERALSWFNRIAAGRLKPPGITDSTPETFEGGAVVVSKPSRGW